MAILTCIYVTAGGYMATAINDFIQGIVMLFGIVTSFKSEHHAKQEFPIIFIDSGNSIFFIRHTQEKEVPYFTLQLDTKNGRVLQNRGEKNCSRTYEVEKFEQLWITTVVMPWINQKKERKTA